MACSVLSAQLVNARLRTKAIYFAREAVLQVLVEARSDHRALYCLEVGANDCRPMVVLFENWIIELFYLLSPDR